MGDAAKYVKLYCEALAPIPCGRVVPQSCLGDSLSPESDGPCLLRRGSAKMEDRSAELAIRGHDP